MNAQESSCDIRCRPLLPEDIYNYDHPDVVYWTKAFGDRAKKSAVLANVEAAIKHGVSRTTAATVGCVWLDFSRHVPKFLTKAVAQTDNPERQHHLIQIAYDELGGRNKKLIHSMLFAEALAAIGIQLPPLAPVSDIGKVLNMLDETLADAVSEEGVIGLLMSFEIIAHENIEMLFQCLCCDDAAPATLSATPFFKIHRQDETEHIRHSVANFLRFCPTEAHRKDFMRSFDNGIEFWQRFWDQTARMINAAASACADASKEKED